jgi:hypothetical protein
MGIDDDAFIRLTGCRYVIDLRRFTVVVMVTRRKGNDVGFV